MPSDKRNFVTAKAMGLIFALYLTLFHPKTCLLANRSSSNACIMVLLKLTFVLLCAQFLSPLSESEDLRHVHNGFSARLGLARALLTLFFA